MRTLVGAILEKYAEPEEGEGTSDGFIQVFVPKSGPHSRSQDTGKLQLPARLTLDSQEINSAGDGDDISEQCGHVKELDLTNNIITDWKEVFKILEHMPCLQFLNFTKNPLGDKTFDDGPGKSFSNVRDIALNCTGVSWLVVAKLLACLPNLAELHVSLNKYRCVDLPEDFVHKSLTKLFVNNSEIDDWADIKRLGKAFPCLQTLNVIETNISILSTDSEYTEFPALSVLNISQCQIRSWDEVEKFRRFPSLTNLRITGLPLVEDWEAKQRRQHMIARLPNISQLNGGITVTEAEREDAERAFLRFFMNSEDKPTRYHELEEKHGKLDPLANVKFERSDYLKLLVKFEEKEALMDIYLHQTSAEFKKKLQIVTGFPPSKMNNDGAFSVKFEDKQDYMDVYLHQTVGDLKKLLRNLTELPIEKTKVFYVEMFDGKVKDFSEMKIPSRTLLNYNMYHGDEIHIHRKGCA